MDVLLQDVRSGLRQLRRHRASSLVAVLTLALGVGVSTALFSVIDATLLRPLPYPHPERLVTLNVAVAQPGREPFSPSPAFDDLRTWEQSRDVLDIVAGVGSVFGGSVADGPKPRRVDVTRYTETYLPLHGVTPLLGRAFTAEDLDPAAPLVAILGYGYWQNDYGGRADVLGKTMRLDDEAAIIIGVLPPTFDAATPVALPLRIPAAEQSRRGTGRVSVQARLQPGVTLEQAQAVLSSRMPQETLRDGSKAEVSVVVTSRLEQALGRVTASVQVLAAAVALIVLIAAVNVAGLLLARGLGRAPEMAFRASLGAGRWRLVRQLLTESALLAVPAAALGIAFAWVTLDLLVANLPLTAPANAPIAINRSVLAMTLALLVPITLLFALLPALRLSRTGTGLLTHGGRQVGAALSRRGGQALIAAEVALAVVLVAGAGLMLRSFARIGAVDLGFEPNGLMTMEVLPLESSAAAQMTYYDSLLERLRARPEVEHAGIVDNFPLLGVTSFTSAVVEGKSSSVTVFDVMPGYFETIGARLREGRLLSATDQRSGFRGAVLNESAAKLMFPGVSPIGRTFLMSGKEAWVVLGVIADIRQGGPLAVARVPAQVFFPFSLSGRDLRTAATVVVRGRGRVPGLGQAVRAEAETVGPKVLVESVRSADERFGQVVSTPKRRAVLFSLLGGFGLALALVGIFGMTAYAVHRRTAEIGVRMTFGARPAQILRTIVRDAAWPIAGGTALGLLAATFATRAIQSFLFETTPTDPATLAAVAVLLGGAGCLAALAPAIRASRIDPVSSLRTE